MRIAVIPARGGSKRIPRKNIKKFSGKPMIAHALLAAFKAKAFDHVIVSTDDDEIAKIARDFGAATPFKRPPELADDFTPTVPVIAHAIRALGEIGIEATQVCCIYPCVPLLSSSDIIRARDVLDTTADKYVFAVAEFPAAVQRALKRDAVSGRVSPILPEFELSRSQDLEPAYHDAGQFYWGSKAAWLTRPRIHSGGIGFVIPAWRVVDIDTQEDWVRAELIYKALEFLNS